ncbi:MAG: response regulator [Candidatus Latescibacteria bacterium]|nr:response regulator [Candidatus Latescibacterota bacterium]
MKNILVVDDERDVREVLGDILDFLGYHVTAVPDGKKALKMAKGGFDLVITDLNMPKMGGKKLLKAIKLRAPQLPVAVVTGYGASETWAEVKAMGAEGFLEKPFRISEVKNLVEHTMEASRR